MMKRHKKIIYYSDLLNDDFSGSRVPQKKINSKNFKYIHKGKIYRFWSWFLYYFFASPIVAIVTFFGFNIIVKGRKNVRSLKKKGYFIYGNHTRWIDMAIPYVNVGQGRRVALVANPAAVGIKGLGAFVNMLGILPLPQTFGGAKNFLKAMEYRLDHHNIIAIYPEAHIWPFYTKIRPFSDASFGYPVSFNAPVVAMCTVYKKAFFFPKIRKPRMVIYLSKPFYPDLSLSKVEASKKLRDQCYDFMIQIASTKNEVEYYDYVFKEKKDQ